MVKKQAIRQEGRKIAAAAVAAATLVVTGCGGPGSSPVPEPVVLRPAAQIAADIGADPAFPTLPADAQMLVRRVLARQSLASLCAGGTEAIKQATRRAVIAAMTAGDIAHPRRAGTAAGRYLSQRCRK